jgi:beta-glucanase (GH16 family)
MAFKKQKSTLVRDILLTTSVLLFILLPVFVLSLKSNTTTQTHAATFIPVGQTGNWNMIFNDEFDATSLDLTKWIMCNPSFASSCNPWNNEKEKFNVAATNNANVMENNGALHLITTKDANGQIWSGMISSGPNKFNYNLPGYTGFQFTYGYVEGKVKTPKGAGFWPSMWMLPDQDKYGGWPGSGEYDIFEIAGNNPQNVYMTEHDGQNAGPGDSAMTTIADSSADYHVYGFEWAPDHLAWYIDGIQARPMICTTAYAQANPGKCNTYRNAAAIKNYPFYVIANFSVGGDWPPLAGGPNASTIFPASMDIDYIRIWQKGPETTAAPTAIVTPTNTPIPTTTPIPTITPLPTNTPVPTVTPTPVASINLVKNGSFESTLSPWYLNVTNSARATLARVTDVKADGVASAKVTITTANASNLWYVQMKEDALPLVAGRKYNLSFWAKANKNHQIQVPIQKNTNPYTVYYQPTVTVTPTWQKFSYTFTAPTTDNTAFIGFNLAQVVDTVWIDGVTVTAQ